MVKQVTPLALYGVLLISLLGCGASDNPWGRVNGVVTCEGQPVHPAIVLFANRQGGIEMTAETDASGHFAIRTERIDGLPVGTYRVAVMPKPSNLPLPEQGMMFNGPAPTPSASPIPELDRDSNTTRLQAIVGEGSNEFTFRLQP